MIIQDDIFKFESKISSRNAHRYLTSMSPQHVYKTHDFTGVWSPNVPLPLTGPVAGSSCTETNMHADVSFINIIYHHLLLIFNYYFIFTTTWLASLFSFPNLDLLLIPHSNSVRRIFLIFYQLVQYLHSSFWEFQTVKLLSIVFRLDITYLL